MKENEREIKLRIDTSDMEEVEKATKKASEELELFLLKSNEAYEIARKAANDQSTKNMKENLLNISSILLDGFGGGWAGAIGLIKDVPIFISGINEQLDKNRSIVLRVRDAVTLLAAEDLRTFAIKKTQANQILFDGEEEVRFLKERQKEQEKLIGKEAARVKYAFAIADTQKETHRKYSEMFEEEREDYEMNIALAREMQKAVADMKKQKSQADTVRGKVHLNLFGQNVVSFWKQTQMKEIDEAIKALEIKAAMYMLKANVVRDAEDHEKQAEYYGKEAKKAKKISFGERGNTEQNTSRQQTREQDLEHAKAISKQQQELSEEDAEAQKELAEKRRKEGQLIWFLTIEDAIKSYEIEQGELWKFTEEGQAIYRSYFAAKRNLYEEDADALAEIQKEIHEYEKKLIQHTAKDREDVYKRNKVTLKETLASGVITKEQHAQQEEQLTIQYLENEIALRKTYGGDTLDLENQLADMRIAIKEREAAEAEAIRKKEAADAEAARQAELQKQQAAIKKQQDYIKGLGKDIGKLGDQISTPWLSAALDGLGNTFEKFSDKFKKKTEENTEAAKEGAEAQGDIWAGLAGDIEKCSEILVSMTGTLFAKQNEQLQEEIEAAKEKYEALSQKYDEAVEKRKESDEELQSLEEQAKNARGGRLLTIQSQIDAEMAKNKQLADHEKKLQSDKDKAQKEIEKKQKQQKKNELKQQLVTAIANTAEGIAKALGQWGFPLGIINAALVAAAGAIQIATISKQMSKLEDGGLLRGRRHRDGGMPILGSNIEVEGGEYVVNRDSTAKNLGLIRYINGQRRELGAEDISAYFARPLGVPAFSPSFSHMMEQGGQVPMMPTAVDISNSDLLQSIQSIKFEPRVAVTDIHTVQGQMAQVDEWVGL